MQLKFLPSFVKRKGRITKKQTHSLSSLSEFSVKSIQEVEGFSKHFDKCYLEIGFGNAENIIFQAINNPSYLFIGSEVYMSCLLYTSPSPRDRQKSRMPSSA